MSNAAPLFQPFAFKGLKLANRIVMAPMTRSFSPGGVPTPAVTEYYRKRAAAAVGLIVSEGTVVQRPSASNDPDVPHFWGDAALGAWQDVINSVHQAGGVMAPQLWHVGAARNPRTTWTAPPPVDSPSGLSRPGKAFGEPMTDEAIADTIAAFAKAAGAAKRLGFDTIELHGAHGYLIDQFLRETTNLRTDGYGGSPENRIRFALEVVDAVAAEIGAGRTGIRLSPVSPANDSAESNPQAVFGPLVEALNQRGIAFIHFVEGSTGGPRDLTGFDFAWARQTFKGAYIANNGYTRDMAIDAIASGRADAVAFGRAYISNPDLVQRLIANAPLAKAHSSTFYAPGPEGYIDYPAM